MNLILNKNNTMFFLMAMAVPIVALISFSEKIAMNTVIVLGQAHFLMAYIYANKYNKIDKKYIYKFLSLVFVFGGFSYFIFFEGNPALLDLFLFSTLLVFSFHYFNDEIKISSIQEIRNRKIGILSVLFSFLALLLATVFKVSNPLIYPITAISLFFGVIFAIGFFEDKKIHFNKILFFVFFLGNLFLPIYLTYVENIAVYKIAGFIILFHYTRWYLRYLDIFSGQKLKEYLSFVFLCNLFFVLLFTWYYLAPGTGILFLLFSPAFFFGWTLIHIIMSIRKEDALF